MQKWNNISSALDWVHEQLQQPGLCFSHGNDDPWDEAVFLTLHCVGLPLDSGADILDQPVTASQCQQIYQLTRRRVDDKVPLAYLMQRAGFAGLEFYVDERVLIPRSPLAELIEVSYKPWVVPNKVQRVLDLCAGSGCIAVATAHYMSHVQVDAVDICQDALAVAHKNAIQHTVQKQVNLIQSDLFEALPGKTYDVIVSNPPYVNASDMRDMPDEFRHEPMRGLAAGDDGLDIVERILQQAATYLTAQGVLIVEVGASQPNLMLKYPKLPFVWLEFARGGTGVFVLTKQQLMA